MTKFMTLRLTIQERKTMWPRFEILGLVLRGEGQTFQLNEQTNPQNPRAI